MTETQRILISSRRQQLDWYYNDALLASYAISTGKNGLGELQDSGCTPRGWHAIYSCIGMDAPVNSVFVGRVWTGEIYTESLAQANPGRDWILTRIMQLEGLETGRNRGGQV